MKKRWILLSAAVAVAVGSWALLGGPGDSHAQEAGTPPPPAVTVAQTLVRPVSDTDAFTGRLQAVDTVRVHPRVSGYVTAVHFKEGARVRKGELLFTIDPRPYQAEVDRLAATLDQARAEQKLAASNAERAHKLLAKHAISTQEADRLATAAASARAHAAATDAALDAAQLDRGFTEVRAPIDGRVSNARITAGNLVTPADVLTSVVSVDPMYAYFTIDEHAFLKLDTLRRQRGTAPRVAMGLVDEQGYPHEGRIDFVDNQLDAGSGTIRLRAVFDNDEGRYTPGLYVRLELRTPSTKPRALIDERAVGTDLGNKFVYVLDKDRKVEYRKVTLGPLVDGLRVVKTGLTARDVVVVNGLQHVRPGMEVNPTLVAMDSRSLDADNRLAGAGGSNGKVASRN
ncbi:efflux RND transporter periplasmic adaptor subunit [Frateuria sp. STR12]|uniref:efflux RND transporter periplasmic adaptor subunit n=1 Tax=Frateuria hangzhouensis TaxID=2995589 RepID=UPI002260CC72|nr:efflux RND transporter periplasmic adaptor subunit [Frateuria sp. STR12]MCX7513395.1 efflux RND transporter periplasmic adaptor subunit [Frateuria sp. STR12]